MLSIGLMSGTSMDGIDAALLETDGSEKSIQEWGHTSLSYDPAFKILLKAAEFAVRQCSGNMVHAQSYYKQAIQEYLIDSLQFPATHLNNKIIEIEQYLHCFDLEKVIQHSTHLHYLAVKKLLKTMNHALNKIDVIGYHGQTLFHSPSQRISIAAGNGQSLANQLGIPVVHDFRRQDIAAGGQGAPFSPLYHQALAIRDKKIPLAVINCGGIANITLIHNENALDLRAFDIGPGNGLIDALVKQRTQGKENMDEDGHYGKKGRINEDIIPLLYEKAVIQSNQPYFTRRPPKSLDIGDLKLIPELQTLSLEDACATLEAFTADTIVNSFQWESNSLPSHWILAGGGWNNPMIRHELSIRSQKKWGNAIKIQLANEIGWNSQAMEAQIFAYFAVRRLQNKPLSVPGTTQVPYPLTGGQVYTPA